MFGNVLRRRLFGQACLTCRSLFRRASFSAIFTVPVSESRTRLELPPNAAARKSNRVEVVRGVDLGVDLGTEHTMLSASTTRALSFFAALGLSWSWTAVQPSPSHRRRSAVRTCAVFPSYVPAEAQEVEEPAARQVLTGMDRVPVSVGSPVDASVDTAFYKTKPSTVSSKDPVILLHGFGTCV